MKQYLILITLLTLQSCSQDDNSSTTELEGVWSTICVPSFTFFDDSIVPNHKVVATYQGNNILTVVNTYSDENCSQLVASVEASQSTLFADPAEVVTSFSIGESVTTSNGVLVKKIDFLTANNEIKQNIFLMQDNNNTLYFGLPCLLSASNCIDDRPTEINYASPYIRVK